MASVTVDYDLFSSHQHRHFGMSHFVFLAAGHHKLKRLERLSGQQVAKSLDGHLEIHPQLTVNNKLARSYPAVAGDNVLPSRPINSIV